MKSTKIFVGGLPWATDSEALRKAFASFGNIREAVVVTDRDTGRSRGFGFVTFEATEGAESAVTRMNGAEFGGRTLKVDFADDKPPRRDFGGGFRR